MSILWSSKRRGQPTTGGTATKAIFAVGALVSFYCAWRLEKDWEPVGRIFLLVGVVMLIGVNGYLSI
jgi:hypothetical protein